jgi:hypothetical protein
MMNTTLTRIAMTAPIVAALLALTSGWDVAQAQPGPNVGDLTTNQPVIDPKPPVKHFPVDDIDDIDVADPGDAPQPPADDPTPPADTDDSDHGDDDSDDSDSSHGVTPAGGTSGPTTGTVVPVPAETDTVFDASATRNASEKIAPDYVKATGVERVPAGVVFGFAALLVAVIGWAAFQHRRLSA